MLKQPNEVRRSIGLSGQFAAVDEYLTGRENLQMVGQLYQMRAKAAKARAGELLEQFNLADAADRPAKTYSGGMRRRLDLAAALVVSPPVMFMDEPTTGLDPRNRQQLWEVIKQLVSGGTTLLLTTQYLEEADHLAHDIAVVDHGRVIARGTSDQLKARTGGERVEVVVHEREHIQAAAEVLAGFGKGETTVEEHTRKLTVPVTGGAKLLAEVIRELDTRGIEIDDIGLRRPTLDDVFLSLTGHVAEIKDEETAAAPAQGRRPRRRPPSERRHRHRAGRGPRATGVSQSVRDSLVVAKRNLIRMTRIPEMVIFGLIQPIMFVVLFTYVFGGSMKIGDTTDPGVYKNFLMAGIFAQTVTFATAGAGAGIADDMHKGLIDRFRSLPMARGAVLTGRTLADLVQTALTLVVLAIVALLVGWRVADQHQRGQGPRRLRPAAPARLRVHLDRRPDRPVRAHPRGGHVRRADLALPGHVHLERVRGLQQDDALAAAHRRVEPVQRHRPGLPAALRQSGPVPVGRLAHAAPGLGLADLLGPDHRDLPDPGGPQVPLGDGMTTTPHRRRRMTPTA